MKKIPAASVNLSADSPVWELLDGLDHGSVYRKDGKDTIILDVEWFLESKKELTTDASDFGKKVLDRIEKTSYALDREPVCKGWNKLHLLYFWPS